MLFALLAPLCLKTKTANIAELKSTTPAPKNADKAASFEANAPSKPRQNTKKACKNNSFLAIRLFDNFAD